MKASELIERVTALKQEHGDMEVFLDVSADGLLDLGEIDVDAEDTGIIIWPADREEAA